MFRWLGIVLFLFIVSCTTLRTDPSIPATDAGFPSAEGVVGGERFRGIKIVSVKEGQSLADLDFKIQGLFSGTVKIDSMNCQLDESVRYQNSSLVEVPLSGSATRSCVVNFLVSPEYPRQQSQAVVVHGFKGALAIRVLKEDEAWIGKEVVLPVSSDRLVKLDLRETSPVRVIFFGCGIEYSEKLYPEEDGSVEIPLSEIASQTQSLCVASGLVISSEYEDLMVDVIVARHSGSFVDLSKPNVTFDEDKVCITADPVVSFLMTDKESSNCTKKCFKGVKLIRGVTVKGRSFVGEIKDGEVQWK